MGQLSSKTKKPSTQTQNNTITHNQYINAKTISKACIIAGLNSDQDPNITMDKLNIIKNNCAGLPIPTSTIPATIENFDLFYSKNSNLNIFMSLFCIILVFILAYLCYKNKK